MKTSLVIITGPTASGKNDLALDLAARLPEGGVLINADSMQIYQELRLITARPPESELSRAPHRLFGVVNLDDPWSAARWRQAALVEIKAAHAAGKRPILVGGTGFYLSALLDGLSPIPEIPAEIRAAETAKMDEMGVRAYHAELAARDAEMAIRLKPTDRQRLIRAGEVLAATGRSLAYWQAQPRMGAPLPYMVEAVLMMPPRTQLYPRIDARFDLMLAAGALDEVRRIAHLDRDLPGLRAVGVRALLSHLDGEIDLKEAVRLAKRDSRRYAKRQLTWIRHQLARPRAGHYVFEVVESLYQPELVERLQLAQS